MLWVFGDLFKGVSDDLIHRNLSYFRKVLVVQCYIKLIHFEI